MKSSPVARFRAVLNVATTWEATGKAWFQRSTQDMIILVRDPRLWNGPIHEHWKNAREIERELVALKVLNHGIEIDAHSGHLVIRVPNIYPKGV